MGAESSVSRLSIAEAAQRIGDRTLSPVELTTGVLDRIKEVDDRIRAYVTVMAEEALESARSAEQVIASGRYLGPLHGIPGGVKDLCDTQGVPTTSSSKVRANYVPTRDAAIVERLRQAGAIVVGKTVTHEFAYGVVSSPTRNPWDLDCIPGGSSGGSGAAVAAGACLDAIGSDTGGSIRIPAALCGVVGMKPTFGRVGKGGVFPLARTLDHVGPLTRTVEDNAILLSALAGHEPRDLHSEDRPPEDFARDLDRGVRGATVGVPTGFFFEHVEREVGARVREAIEAFRGLGALVREVEVPNVWETLHAQRLTLAAEAYAVHEERLRSEPERFDDQGLERLLKGEELRAYRYANAQERKLLSRREFEAVLGEVDVILTPSVPIPATEIGQREVTIEGREEAVYSALTRLTGPTNMNGLPSLSVPCGTTASRLPVGLQLIGRPFDEATLYRFGHAFEESFNPAR